MYLDEGPQHGVAISTGFLLDKFLTTQSQYTAVMGGNPSFFAPGGEGNCFVTEVDTRNFPVESVSHEDAESFCRRLSALPEEVALGFAYRLPTEAEWEYACRGNAPVYSPYSFGQKFLPGEVNMDPAGVGADSRTRLLRNPCPVGSYTPNSFGLYDMHSNVGEWCSDWYDKDYYSKSPVIDPPGPSTGSLKVSRGGCFWSDAATSRSAFRNPAGPTSVHPSIGFRVVLVRRNSGKESGQTVS
jgi:formylglycine-generating enzyme required for sulfatase activity